MHKILITGHSGFAGKILCASLKAQKIPYLGLSRHVTRRKDIPSNLTKAKNLSFLDIYSISGIIHLAAETNLNYCEKNPEKTRAINVTACKMIAEFAKKENIPLVFASSDMVFDGEKGSYSNIDEAHPINVYGKQKLAAEREITSIYPNAVICRLPLLLGEHGGYLKYFLDNARAKKEQILFADETRSAIQVEDAVQLLYEALTWKGGVYHLPGPKAMTRYELGVQLADQYNLDSSLLKKGRQSDFESLAKRPRDASMISTKNRQL